MQNYQLHILVGCADARDLSQLHVDVMNRKIREYKERGIRVEFHNIRTAGSFITPDVFEDIRQIILDSSESVDIQINKEYFVHIQTHGHLTETSNRDYVSHIYNMAIVEGSNLNCGMLGATGVGVELEQLLVESRLTYATSGGTARVEKDEDIRSLLREVYGYDGYLAGDWIKSIDYLRTHPRAQKARLEHLIEADSLLCTLGIQITAGIQDYSIHALIRLDGGVPEVPWWDEMQQELRQCVGETLTVLKQQSEQQKPLAGLLCMADPWATSRTLAARYYLKSRGLISENGYLPNTIFNITGSTFDVPDTPFGPYVIAGFFYAVKYLRLTDQMVMGNDEAQTERMLAKLRHDPIMRMLAAYFRVNFIPITQRQLLEQK